MEEILNIEYNRKRLILLALKRANSSLGASKILGISRRTLDKYLTRQGITRPWRAEEQLGAKVFSQKRPLQSVA